MKLEAMRAGLSRDKDKEGYEHEGWMGVGQLNERDIFCMRG